MLLKTTFVLFKDLMSAQFEFESLRFANHMMTLHRDNFFHAIHWFLLCSAELCSLLGLHIIL